MENDSVFVVSIGLFSKSTFNLNSADLLLESFSKDYPSITKNQAVKMFSEAEKKYGKFQRKAPRLGISKYFKIKYSDALSQFLSIKKSISLLENSISDITKSIDDLGQDISNKKRMLLEEKRHNLVMNVLPELNNRLDKVLEVLVSDWLSDIEHEIGLEKQVEDSIYNFQIPLSSGEIADNLNDFSVQYGVEEQIIASVDENLSKGFPQPMIEVLENQMSEKLDQLNQYIADL